MTEMLHYFWGKIYPHFTTQLLWNPLFTHIEVHSLGVSISHLKRGICLQLSISAKLSHSVQHATWDFVQECQGDLPLSGFGTCTDSCTKADHILSPKLHRVIALKLLTKFGNGALSHLHKKGVSFQWPLFLTSIFEGQSPKTRPFPMKTMVIWVPGRYIYIYINPYYLDHWRSSITAWESPGHVDFFI